MALTARERLIRATKALLWERGFAAMSPRAILDTAGVGQGSLYHHFAGKSEIARTAIDEFECELTADAQRLLGDATQPALARVLNYLRAPRSALRGCRIGRLAYDAEVISSPELREPLAATFTHIADLLQAALREAQAQGELRADCNCRDLALAIIATLQGAYIVARAQRDAGVMPSAVEGLVALLEMNQ
jgi:AcrR family transcriptional regulator